MSTPNDTTIPYGYCHCGCGQKTNIAQKTNAVRGVKQGEPSLYKPGHHKRLPLIDRFWVKVDRSGGEDACWVWIACLSDKGYGQFVWHGRQEIASRVSYEIAYGVRPGNLEVCHSCDNPPCVNPKHLWLGTRQDNIADSVQKGRTAASKRLGEKHPFCNISDETIAEIRRRYEAGESIQKELAADFGVSRGYICEIVHYRVRV